MNEKIVNGEMGYLTADVDAQYEPLDKVFNIQVVLLIVSNEAEILAGKNVFFKYTDFINFIHFSFPEMGEAENTELESEIENDIIIIHDTQYISSYALTVFLKKADIKGLDCLGVRRFLVTVLEIAVPKLQQYISNFTKF